MNATAKPELEWPGGGALIADLLDGSREFLLEPMKSEHWRAKPNSTAELDRLTLDAHFDNLGVAGWYAAGLVAANAENLAGLATLYRNEATLTLSYLTVVRAFLELASSSWWVLSVGVLTENDVAIDPSVTKWSVDQANEHSRQRVARAMLLHAEDLRHERARIKQRFGTESTEHRAASLQLEDHRYALSNWSNQKLAGKPNGWEIEKQRLCGYTDLVPAMLDDIWPTDGIRVYRGLSGITHGNRLSVFAQANSAQHDGHIHYGWGARPIEAERVARLVLYVWAGIVQMLLAMYGYDQRPIQTWKSNVDGLLRSSRQGSEPTPGLDLPLRHRDVSSD